MNNEYTQKKKWQRIFFSSYLVVFLFIGVSQLRKITIDDCKDVSGKWVCEPIEFNGLQIPSRTILSWDEKYVGDIVSYLKMGEAWLGRAPMDEAMKWRFKNWPPLIPLENALFLFLEPFISFGLAKLLVSAVLGAWLWSLMSVESLKSVRPKWSLLFLLVPLLALVAPDLRSQLFGRGLFYSESQALLFFMLGLFYFLVLIRDFSQRSLVLTTLWWSLASYSRAQLDTSIWWVLAIVAVVLFVKNLWMKITSPSEKGVATWKPIAVLLLALSVTTAPWKMRNYLKAQQYSMITTSGSVFQLHWTPTEALPYWMSHINTGCILKPELCQFFQKNPTFSIEGKKYLSLATLFHNPLAWWQKRRLYWREYLVPNPKIPNLNTFYYLSWGWQAKNSDFWATAEWNFSLLLWAGVALMLLLICSKNRSLRAHCFRVFLWLFLWTGLHFIFFLLLPAEPRYFAFWRWTPLVALLVLLGYLPSDHTASGRKESSLNGDKLT